MGRGAQRSRKILERTSLVEISRGKRVYLVGASYAAKKRFDLLRTHRVKIVRH